MYEGLFLLFVESAAHSAKNFPTSVSFRTMRWENAGINDFFCTNGRASRKKLTDVKLCTLQKAAAPAGLTVAELLSIEAAEEERPKLVGGTV